jgi:hypothetical protein
MDSQNEVVRGGVIHDIREALTHHRDQISRATILNEDHELLATGDALLEGGHGVFWPYVLRHEEVEDLEPAILRWGNGTEKQLRIFERCSSSAYAFHFHFEI